MAPKNLLAVASATSGITLAWSANTESNLSGYNVYRSTSASGPFTKLNTVLLTSPAYLDTTASAGLVAFYQVTAVNSSSKESTPATISAVAVDAKPTNFTATGSVSGIALTWSANTELDLAGYNLYSGPSAAGPFTKIYTTLLTTLSYNDTAAIAGQTTLLPINRRSTHLGHESAPAAANAIRTVATAPRDAHRLQRNRQSHRNLLDVERQHRSQSRRLQPLPRNLRRRAFHQT